MSSSEITHLVVPGTFDPVTLGHMDVFKRARRICPKVTVAVAASVGKNGTGTIFSLEERVEMIREALDDVQATGIEVKPFSGLLMDFCKDIGAQAVVKGLRSITDFEYELQQAHFNSLLSSDVESIFVMSSPEYGYLSSSAVRELVSYGSDVSALVPKNVLKHLTEHFDS